MRKEGDKRRKPKGIWGIENSGWTYLGEDFRIWIQKRKAKINYYDPSGQKKEFSKLKNVSYCNDVEEACKNVDLVIIHTEWEEFKVLDFNKLCKKNKFKIYDMRNLYSPELMKKKGFSYYSIGR